MARGGPADFLACRELQTASVGLRVVYLELRPHRDGREWAVVHSVGATLAAAAAGARVHLSGDEAEAMAREGLALGLFEVVERKREDGVESTEERLVVVPLPPSVFRSRYADRRGARGGKSDAERARESRLRRSAKAEGAATTPSEGGDQSHETEAVKRLEASVARGPDAASEVSTSRDVSRPAAAPVTVTSRDVSRSESVTPAPRGVSPPPSPEPPLKGVPGGGERSTPTPTRGEARQGWEETAVKALAVLGEGTGKALDTAATAAQRRHLGRALLERQHTAADLELVAAWLREVPAGWRAVVPGAKSALVLGVEHLLGERLDNQHTASGLAAMVQAAKVWDRRRVAPAAPGPVPVTRTADPSRIGGLTRDEFMASTREKTG